VLTDFRLLDTGCCLALESSLLRGARHRVTLCHATVALLRHPVEGWLLWDTGYAPRMLEVTRKLPERLYRFATPLRLRPDRSVAVQLGALGLTTNDIRWVILSHLHGDHVAGLGDFRQARIVTTAAAFETIQRLGRLRGVLQGYLPALLPPDFAVRADLIPEFEGPVLGDLGPSFDLFGDGTMRLFALPGHARGQMGLLAATDLGRLLLVADACLHSASIRDGRLPGRAVDLIADDRRAVGPTIARLREFVRANPDVMVLPCHCPEVFERWIGSAP
jgi:glyoxylase-like metal-dependent hydrolase (beta-lactamase superfamily II)